MILKNISAKISSETEEQAYQHIKDLKALFPFLDDLPSVDWIRMAKLSRRYVDFVARCLFHTKANPRYVPPFVDSEEFADDVDLKNTLHRIYQEGAQGARLINQDLAYNYKKMGVSKTESVDNKQEQEKSA